MFRLYASILTPYLQDPESHAGSKVSREMAGTSGIKIAALLDRISEMQNIAATQTEEQKERTQVVSLSAGSCIIYGLILFV